MTKNGKLEGGNKTSSYLQLNWHLANNELTNLCFLGESDHFIFNNLQSDEEEVQSKSNGQYSNESNNILESPMKKMDNSNKDQAR